MAFEQCSPLTHLDLFSLSLSLSHAVCLFHTYFLFLAVVLRRDVSSTRNKPMHVLLAPPYAALWKEWASNGAARADAAATEAKEAKDEAIARLAQDMRAARAPQPPLPPQPQTEAAATATLGEAPKSETVNASVGGQVQMEVEAAAGQPSVNSDNREVPDAWDASDDEDDEDGEDSKKEEAAATTATPAVAKSSADAAATSSSSAEGGELESWEDLASDDDDESTDASASASTSNADEKSTAAATTSSTTTTAAAATAAREARAHGQRLKQQWLAREASPQWQAMVSACPFH